MGTLLEKLNQLSENLSSNKGGNRDSIYLPSVYEDCHSNDDKKARRKKIRQMAEKYCSDIITCKDSSKLVKLIADFKEFYKLCYIHNDYTISSIASKQTSSMQLDSYKQMFVIIEREGAKETNEKKKQK